MLVLVCGVKADPPVAMLLVSLESLGIPHLLLDQRDLADRISLNWHIENGRIAGTMDIKGETIDLREITAVFHRFQRLCDVASIAGDKERLRRANATQRSIIDLLDILPVIMVNPRRPMMSNNSKPLQSQIIRAAGFSIPETFITNEPDALFRFMDTNGALIYKSMSSTRSIVSTINRNEIARVDRLHLLPTQFQQKVDGRNVRVHVIGPNAIATRVETNSTDYRYPDKEDGFCRLAEEELDLHISSACIKLARACDLEFCGIDLMVSAESTCCLEVNPSPAYTVYQQHTGQPISDMLAMYLSGEKCVRLHTQTQEIMPASPV